VSLPTDPSDDGEPTLIEAARLQPAGWENEGTLPQAQGVTSITILPAASRACVLCNGTVSFYSLPELSPAPNGREVPGCQWVGGLDLNQAEARAESQDLMVASAKCVTIVRVGEKIQKLKAIQFPGCLNSVRRDTIACVADGQKYALIEVEHQQQIPLFPISSLEDVKGTNLGQVEVLPLTDNSLPARSSSLARHGPSAGIPSGHNRSSSLSNLVSGRGKRQPSPRADTSTREMLVSASTRRRSLLPNQPSSQSESTSFKIPPESLSVDAAGSPAQLPSTPKGDPQIPAIHLRPHIVSLTPNDFLLTTGTTENEPGVGMFVNLEGDVVRGTIEFDCYPDSIVVDRSLEESRTLFSQEQVTASLCIMMRLSEGDGSRRALQILSFIFDSGEMRISRDWVDLPAESLHVGIQSTASPVTNRFSRVANRLRLGRLQIPECHNLEERAVGRHTGSKKMIPEWEVKRNKEEAQFAQRFGGTKSQVIVWSGNNVHCLSANPFILQLEARLQSVHDIADDHVVTKIFAELRNQDAQTESDFLSINYIRQKASLIIFTKLMASNLAESTTSMMRTTENFLIESNVDPRIVMLLLPLLKEEVLQGPQGIWIPAGLANFLEDALSSGATATDDLPLEFWQMMKRYMATWQGKRGFGSITDEQYVFDSVDAALLRTLLHLEQSLPRGSAAASSIRAKLYNVVDNWKGDFDRAVMLLEKYRRLFPLSRLYQSRRLARDVLTTWKRVINGEVDGVGELNPESAEMQMRRYLVNIRDASLVQEYVLWLAQKNPDLAVEVLTDDKSRVKFPPPQALELLKKEAPGAVQNYLEYLVFNKGNTQYADDLVGYYLDSVLSVLESSEAARDILAQSYSTYRALEPPKPTYLSFIHENQPSEAWWQSRLRLLQLLGGGSYASGSSSAGSELAYSIPTVLARLAPFSSYLVSESIILDARQGMHRQALGLLTHGLGDYDTAVRYCYFAGPQSATAIPIDETQLPTFDVQKELFDALLDEFLLIEDLSTRLDRSSELLAKFAKWFDPVVVLDKIPDDWSLDVLAEFLLRTIRALRGELLEVSVVKALSAAENLGKQAEFVEMCEKLGARIEAEKALGSEGSNEAADARSDGTRLGGP
jgi:vacuolar protein sorting-associated protein 3